MYDEIVNHPVTDGPSNALPFPYMLSPIYFAKPTPVNSIKNYSPKVQVNSGEYLPRSSVNIHHSY